MVFENAQQYWALLSAGGIAVAVLVFIALRLLQDSARGRLAAEVGKLRKQEKTARKAARATGKAQARLDKLASRSDSVKPRLVDEAKGKLEDARSLQKIADDQVLVARNLVRQIIVEEYPPKRQEALRRRLLPGSASEEKPFTMSA